MRRFVFVLAFCLTLSVPALAEEPPAAPAGTPKVEIIEDQEAGAVRVLIDGKEVLTIDASGLHVSGSIIYTGSITDIGESAHAP
jgi:hypothetical protein